MAHNARLLKPPSIFVEFQPHGPWLTGQEVTEPNTEIDNKLHCMKFDRRQYDLDASVQPLLVQPYQCFSCLANVNHLRRIIEYQILPSLSIALREHRGMEDDISVVKDKAFVFVCSTAISSPDGRVYGLVSRFERRPLLSTTRSTSKQTWRSAGTDHEHSETVSSASN